MKLPKALILLMSLVISNISNAQADANKYIDSLSIIVKDGEIEGYIELPELLINYSKEEIERIRTMAILERRVLRVYPYVLEASNNLSRINNELSKMDSEREKSKYIKEQRKILEEKFEKPLINLSKNDGKILIKLIHRQTGQTAFNLIKEYRSGWTAFWSNQFAKMYTLNLKNTFNPNETIEDFYLEYILEDLANKNKINYKHPVLQFNREKLKTVWKEKLGDSGYYPEPIKQ